MKKQIIYHTVETVPKFNRKITERGKIDNLNTNTLYTWPLTSLFVINQENNKICDAEIILCSYLVGMIMIL